MSPEALQSFIAIGIGFALAGALTSGYQAMAARPAGFGLLGDCLLYTSPSPRD